MFSERTSVGLDVHARSIVGCGLDTVSGAVTRRRLSPTIEGVSAWLAELPAPVADWLWQRVEVTRDGL